MDHPVDAGKMGKRCLKIGQVNDLQGDATCVEMMGQEFLKSNTKMCLNLFLD